MIDVHVLQKAKAGMVHHRYIDLDRSDMTNARELIRDLARAVEDLTSERNAAYEKCAQIAESFGQPYAIQSNTGAMMFRAVTTKIAAAIRSLVTSQK